MTHPSSSPQCFPNGNRATKRHCAPRLTLPLLAFGPLLLSLLPAQQSTWTKRNPGTSPPARYAQAMAYDSARDRIVLFGGVASNGSTYLGDTWEWNGSTWLLRNPATSPPARFAPGALAYDSARGRCVLFGGSNGGSGTGVLGDTWEWDGTNWTLKSPATSPAARYSQAMADDTARGRVVLFGGTSGLAPGSTADTWEWDGTNWTLRTPVTSPPPHSYHAMAYDSARGCTVLFGGRDVNNNFVGDIWEWDGVAWTQRFPAATPSARYWHAMAYDSERSCVVMFGGRSATSSFLNDTYAWDGTNWSAVSTAKRPAARIYSAMAFDAARGRTVLFGGWGNGVVMADTWDLRVR